MRFYKIVTSQFGHGVTIADECLLVLASRYGAKLDEIRRDVAECVALGYATKSECGYKFV